MEKAAMLKYPEEKGSLVLNGHSNVLKIQGLQTGSVTINGNNTCIYLDVDLEPQHEQTEQPITCNDLIYQLVEVLELLIILLIFYVIFNNIGY